MREALVSARSKLVNCVRGWLRGQTERVSLGGLRTFSARVRELAIAVPSFVERLLMEIESLSEAIVEANKELAALAKADPICVRFMTMPGVGPVTATRFAASIDDVSRFESAHKLESYLGVTPGENSSSERSHNRTGITKAGAPRTRWALVQAAHNMRRTQPEDPLVLWSREVEKRRGKGVAVIALARKIADVLYALWRHNTTYDPKYERPQSSVVAATVGTAHHASNDIKPVKPVTKSKRNKPQVRRISAIA
jgi:transposase